MARYTDEFRAGAVLQLEAAGWPDAVGAISQVSRNLKVPRTTLRRWAQNVSNPPPAELVQRKKIDFVEAIRNEMAAILGEMGKAREDAAFNHLATAFGILFDKHQLLTGGATANVNQAIRVSWDEHASNNN